ncbi:MAG: GNAT family N-acetyltransferase, partial [Euryarchaeota archaeon]
KRLFRDPRFKPDMLKIYPCMVFEDTPLYDLWKRGEYEPYDEETAVRVIAEAKRRYIPEYCRIMRVQRDIPAHLAAAGIRKTNLRQLVHEYMEERGWECRCIRCREAGHRMRQGAEVDPERAELRIIKERTWKGGVDYFLAYEDPEADAILGYLRLRKPTEHAHRPEIDPETAIVRELKVVGPTVPLGERDARAVQHRGLGERLMRKAEELAESELGAERILVISAIGTREYYRRLGYERVGPYMGKELG